ncbi:MAG: LuxR C-terminal-related transcriptional regulator [Chthoniobacterales bacterium]
MSNAPIQPEASDTPGPVLDEVDVRAIVRLLAGLYTAKGNHTSMKRQLMNGLCEMIKADSWAWSLGQELHPGSQPVYVSMFHGGFDEARYSHLLCGISDPDMARISESLLMEMQQKNGHVTRIHQQFTDEKEFRESGIYPHLCAADIGPFLISLRPIDSKSVSTIAIYRRLKDANFTEREARIAHIILTEVAWLHEQGWPEDRGVTVPRLSPRERLILNMLLDGRARKEIADCLGLSENTVSGYQKSIYRHFKVNSHATLMRRFQLGDGGDL